MAAPQTPAARLRHRLDSPGVVFAPLALDAITARLAEAAGFQAGYVSGGALGYAHAVSEALLTLDEICDVTRHVTARSALPIVVDGGVGFGDPVHATRMMWALEQAGAAGVEIEDQVAPKRVSHHRGIEHLISEVDMVAKIEHAAAARRDDDFVIIARTGAVHNESFEHAVARGRAYHAAGADLVMLMPGDEEQWRAAPAEIDAPLATIAALDARTAADWDALGWRLVIDPFTAQVLMVDVVRAAYQSFAATGATGQTVKNLFSVYRELPGIAGLEELYAIEDRTTEKT